MEKLFKFFIVVLFSFSVLNLNPALTKAAEGLSISSIVSKTNEERANARTSALVENDLLTRAAQMKADDMARYEYFSHTSPSGKDPWSWFQKAGYAYSTAGENLAINMPDADSTISAWMNSPKHKANILDQGYSETGVGISHGMRGGESAVFIVQLFASPKNYGTIGYTNPTQRDGDLDTPYYSNVLGAYSSGFSVLRLGSTGERVRELQMRLIRAGYDIGLVDGKFGNMTMNAVRIFQQNMRLVNDGIVGPMTWSLL